MVKRFLVFAVMCVLLSGCIQQQQLGLDEKPVANAPDAMHGAPLQNAPSQEGQGAAGRGDAGMRDGIRTMPNRSFANIPGRPSANGNASISLDCKDAESCKTYCEKNREKCMAYCRVNPSSQICGDYSRREGAPCKTREECDAYCKSNPNARECAGMGIGQDEGMKNGVGGGQRLETPKLALPFDVSNYDPVYWGVWPYCVHGGDHPEGHGGIDFELVQGAKIYAACDGKVEYIIDAVSETEHGSGLMLMCGGIVVDYNGLSNVIVRKGDSVKKGDHIADASIVNNREYYIHFGVNNYMKQQSECPLNYLDAGFKAKLAEMMAKAHYPEQAADPDICNCQSLPYKSTQKTGP